MPLRRALADQRPALALLLALTLLLRLLVPAGFMPVAGTDGGIALAFCPGTAPAAAHAMAGMTGGGDHATAGHAMPDSAPAQHGDRAPHDAQPCAFAGLAFGALGAVAPPVAMAPPGFVALTTPRPPNPPLVPARERLRPPLRAPPLAA